LNVPFAFFTSVTSVAPVVPLCSILCAPLQRRNTRAGVVAVARACRLGHSHGCAPQSPPCTTILRALMDPVDAIA
jgi:hypothetical protein